MFRAAAFALATVACATAAFPASVTPPEGSAEDLFAAEIEKYLAPVGRADTSDFGVIFRALPIGKDVKVQDDFTADPLRGIRPDSQWARPPESSLVR